MTINFTSTYVNISKDPQEPRFIRSNQLNDFGISPYDDNSTEVFAYHPDGDYIDTFQIKNIAPEELAQKIITAEKEGKVINLYV